MPKRGLPKHNGISQARQAIRQGALPYYMLPQPQAKERNNRNRERKEGNDAICKARQDKAEPKDAQLEVLGIIMLKNLKNHTYHVWNTAYEGYQKTSWVFYIIALGAVAGNTLGIPLEGGAATFLFGFMFFYWTGMLHTKLTKGGTK